ncbi:MAG: hypothetical protein ACHQF2_05700 [Flavobacteriales bacterium]
MAACVFVSCAETKTTIKESYENYPNGKTKWHKEVKTIQNKHIERDAAFLRIITEFRSYYEDGTLFQTWKLVEDAGPEISCRESLYELKQYHANGKTARTYKMECDCHKEIEKTYNENGKLLTRKKAVIKRLY